MALERMGSLLLCGKIDPFTRPRRAKCVDRDLMTANDLSGLIDALYHKELNALKMGVLSCTHDIAHHLREEHGGKGALQL
jgi:hypothetical protein